MCVAGRTGEASPRWVDGDGQVGLGSASGPSASLGSACVGPGSAQGTSSPKLGNLTKMSSLDLSNTSEWSVLSQDETFTLVLERN